MAIVFLESFDTGLLKTQWNACTLSGVGPRTGLYCMSVLVNGTGGGGILNITAASKITNGFAYYTNNLGQGDPAAGGDRPVWQARGDAGATIHLSLYHTATGALVLRRGTGTGTILATSAAGVLVSAVWKSIEVQATINDTTGTCIVRVDGATVINFTGDTKNAGTATTIDQLRYSAIGWQSTTDSMRWDDMWIVDGTDDTAVTGTPDNSFMGDLKVECLLPNGDGDSSQWVGSDGNSVNNSLLVDEPGGPNTSDYVGSATSGNRDLYNFTNLGPYVSAVLAIQQGCYAAKSDAGAATLKPVLKESGGTVTVESTVTLSTTYQAFFSALRKVKPSGGSWSVSDVNGLQAGVEV